MYSFNYRLLSLVCLFVTVILSACNLDKRSYANDTQDKLLIANGIRKCINYYKENPDSIDPHNYFKPFASDLYYPNTIIVDTILYRSDSLVGVVFFVIDINNVKHKDKEGKALMIYRESLNSAFALYPLPPIETSFETNQTTLNLLEDQYFNHLDEYYNPSGLPYGSNVGSPDFWNNSLYFTRVTGGYYYFQTIYNYSKAQLEGIHEYIPLNYPKCDKAK